MKKPIALILSLASILIFSCNEDNPNPADETELITSVELRFKEVGSNNSPFIAYFNDPDGAGGEAPFYFGNLEFEVGKTYTVEPWIFNKVNPSEVKDITEEVKSEDELHQFFFSLTPSSLITHTYSDNDENNNPVGLLNTFTAGNTPGSGKLKVILRHKPSKTAPGVAEGNPTNAGGETDVEVEFDFLVK